MATTHPVSTFSPPAPFRPTLAWPCRCTRGEVPPPPQSARRGTSCGCEVTCPKPSHPQVGRAVSIEIYDPGHFLPLPAASSSPSLPKQQRPNNTPVFLTFIPSFVFPVAIHVWELAFQLARTPFSIAHQQHHRRSTRHRTRPDASNTCTTSTYK